LVEIFQPLRIGRRLLRQDFQRNVALKPCVPRTIHLTHTSPSQQRQNLVRADEGIRLQHDVISEVPYCCTEGPLVSRRAILYRRLLSRKRKNFGSPYIFVGPVYSYS